MGSEIEKKNGNCWTLFLIGWFVVGNYKQCNPNYFPNQQSWVSQTLLVEAIKKFIKYGSLEAENPVALNNFPIFFDCVEFKMQNSDVIAFLSCEAFDLKKKK
jgi:hypothetical protein